MLCFEQGTWADYCQVDNVFVDVNIFLITIKSVFIYCLCNETILDF